MSNIIFPWSTDVYTKLLWLPAIVISVGVILLILNRILLKIFRPENLILLNSVLGYMAISLALSIVLYWYIFIAIILIIRFPLTEILKDDLSKVIVKNTNTLANLSISAKMNKMTEPLENTNNKDHEDWKDSLIKKYSIIFKIFTFFFPVFIIVVYIIIGMGYKL